MSPHRGRLLGVAVVAAFLLPSAAQANIYGSLARGLSLFDFQFGGQRNLLGDGWTINYAAPYNNRRFDFGVADLTLSGVLQGSVGYTMRGIPAASFTLSSGGTPLTYDFNINNGIQDLNMTGSTLINISTRANALGFYDETVQISNRGNFSASGFGLVDSGTTDYDIGPINLHGNLFGDVLAVVTEPFFAANGQENPFAKFSARASRAAQAEKSVEELRSRIQSGEVLSDEEIGKLVNETILAAVLGGNPERLDQLMLSANFLDSAAGPADLSEARFAATPEPTGILLFGFGLLLLPLTRKRG